MWRLDILGRWDILREKALYRRRRNYWNIDGVCRVRKAGWFHLLNTKLSCFDGLVSASQVIDLQWNDCGDESENYLPLLMGQELFTYPCARTDPQQQLSLNFSCCSDNASSMKLNATQATKSSICTQTTIVS